MSASMGQWPGNESDTEIKGAKLIVNGEEAVNFPADWPSGCPPADAVDADGTVFRIVKNDPPLGSDFATHHETGRLKHAPKCLRCGLSVFRELRDAVHQRLLLPKLGPWIAQATLMAEHGRTKRTTGQQPTHTTFWTYEGVDRTALFAIVVEKV